MLRKAGPEAYEDKTFVITKKELRGSHKGNERIQTVMDELLRVIVRIRTTTSKGKPAVMSQRLLVMLALSMRSFVRVASQQFDPMSIDLYFFFFFFY